MSKVLCKEESSRILLVEGADDCHVVMALCAAHDLPHTFGIYECGNDIGVLKRMNALIVGPSQPLVIGVILDADRPSVEGRWQSITQKLAHHKYPLPGAPEPNGTIVRSNTDGPTLGFWLMPDNQVSGMLEDFCRDLAEPDALRFAEICVQEASDRALTSCKDVHRSKAIIHTYLAWQDEPGRPLGQAITTLALRPQTQVAFRFTDWLRRLFPE